VPPTIAPLVLKVPVETWVMVMLVQLESPKA
jgi:hypothetical protein